VNAQYQILLARLPKWQTFIQVPREKAAVGQAPDNEECRMLEIQNLTVTEESLTLDYRVTNHFEDDIRVCEDIDILGKHGKWDVETRIADETVWIRLRLDYGRDPNVLRPPGYIAKYLRLAPGESHSGRILLDLPIRNASPVHRFWFRERRKKRKEIVLHRAVFEVGCFGVKWAKFFDSVSERIKKEGIKTDPISSGLGMLLTFEPLIREEIQDGRSREVVYFTDMWPGLSEQESAKVDITDVKIPCSVVVDDK